MRNRRAIGATALSVAATVVFLSLSALVVFAATDVMTDPAPALRPAQGFSNCVVAVTKTVAPGSVLLGEEVTVTLGVVADCPDECPLHIVLVLEASENMAGSPTMEMKAATADFVRALKLADNPSTEVGVVEYNSTATIVSQLTNNEARIVGGIRRIDARGGVRIDLGIRSGLQVLTHGRGGLPECTKQVMIVLARSPNVTGCDSVLRAANEAKSQGVLLVTICFDSRCDATCMRQAATSPRWYYEAKDHSELATVFEDMRKRIQEHLLTQLNVIDKLPDNMRYVAGSAKPAPVSLSAGGAQIAWRSYFAGTRGITYSLVVLPQQVGHHPTNEIARVDFLDQHGAAGSQTFSVPLVMVHGPASNTPAMPGTPATPTASGSSATPTTPQPTATGGTPPTATPTATGIRATPSPSATATEAHTPTPPLERRIYLPILRTEAGGA